MKLALITDDGEVIEVVDGIEEYNLDKTIARASVVNEIQAAVHRSVAS